MCLLIFVPNWGYKGIHSEEYAEAVLRRLEKAIRGKRTKAEREAAIREALTEMAKILEEGGSFW